MKQGIFFGVIGLCLGIVIGEYRSLSVYGAIYFLCVTIGIIVILRVKASLRTRYTSACLVILCTMSFGIVRTEYSYLDLPSYIFDTSISDTQKITVKVVSPPDVRGDSARFIVEPILSNSTKIHVPHIRMSVPHVHDVAYGDVLILEGKLVPVLTNNKTYKRISESLIRKGVLYEIHFPQINIIERGKGNYFFMKLYVFGDAVKNTIRVYVREPSAAFINGILFGEKHGLSDEWYDMFTHVGLTHVIVLSGYNLAIIFAWTRVALRQAPFFVQHVCGAIAVILLMLVSGADAPAVRAAILVLTASLAALLRRQEDAGHFLSLTIIAMLVWNPFYLLYDVSFQLSVAATYGLTYLAPALGNFILSRPRFVHELLRDTLAAQVAVLPIQLLYFGTLSWISLFANFVVLPFVPILMILGVVVLCTSFVPFIALCVGTMTTVLSDTILGVVLFLSTHTQTFMISISVTTCVVMYGLICLYILRTQKNI